MDKRTGSYGRMLEKYRELDEDEILSNLTEEELHQLEGEIDREVLNKIPEDVVEEDNPYRYSSTDEYMSTSEEEYQEKEQERHRPKLSTIQTKHLNKSLEKQKSSEAMEPRRRSSKTSHQFKIPPLRKTTSREGLKRQKSEEGGELKKELMQAVKHRTKRRSSRANSSGISRRYTRRNSSCLLRNRRSKVAKEDRRETNVNRNFITQEMLSLRPKLKKVQTREPAKINDMLHGVSLGHITSGVKGKETGSALEEEEENGCDTPSAYIDDDFENEEVEEDGRSVVDEAVASANDNVHRRLNARAVVNEVRNDDTMSCTTAGSTSAESYDVIGELSINPNSVEQMLLRIWEDDEHLLEVNLNNIQNVDMEKFDELASAMECNTHVKQLNLANVGLTDKPARALASMLKKNKTLEKLNVESNFITGDAALRIVAALRKNKTLTELRIDNQRHIFGAKVEHEFSKILKDNKTLLRFGYQFGNPGPRMSASNTLTRNMDDVRKKRVTEQRKRAQASRPLLRGQGSIERQRRERMERMKRLQEQGIHLDLHGIVKNEEVQSFLDHMDPVQYAMLEQWFVQKFLNQSAENNLRSSHHMPEPSSTKPRNHLSPAPPRRSTSPPREPSPREKLMESIRNPRQVLPPRKTPSSPTPPEHVDKFSQPRIQMQDPKCAKRRAFFPQNSHWEARQVASNPTTAKSTPTPEELIPWQDGEEYDSDEYEVVEIEVTESEGSGAEQSKCDPAPSIHEPQNDPRTQSAGQANRLDSPGLLTKSSDKLRALSVPRNREQTYLKENPEIALDRLQISNQHPSRNINQRLTPETKKRSFSPASPASSTRSLSPATPRPVKEDDSWIIGTPFHRLGAKK